MQSTRSLAWVATALLGGACAQPETIAGVDDPVPNELAPLPGLRGTARSLGTAPLPYVDTHDHYANTVLAPPPRDYFRKKDGSPAVVLTFDCAYVPEASGLSVLDALKEKGVHATFFIAGPFVTDPRGGVNKFTQSVLRRMVEDGHEFGNHTATHPHTAPTVAWATELATLRDAWKRAVSAVFGAAPPANAEMLGYWRAPYGEYDQRALEAAAAAGYRFHFGWHVDARDALGWPSCKAASPSPAAQPSASQPSASQPSAAQPSVAEPCMTASRQTDHVLRHIEKSSPQEAVVVLAHLGGPYHFGDDPAGLRRLIDTLSKRNYRFAKLSEVAVVETPAPAKPSLQK